MRASQLEETPLPRDDRRSTRDLTDEGARAWKRSAYFEAFAIYRILCYREADEPRHAHRAAEMCIKLAEPKIAILYLRRALDRYAAKGLHACAIAVAKLGLKIAPEDLPFNEKLGNLLTIRDNGAWSAPTIATAAPKRADSNADELRTARPEQWMESSRSQSRDWSEALKPTDPQPRTPPSHDGEREIDFDDVLAHFA